MPCESRIQRGQTLAERNAEITAALRTLEARLQASTVRVVIGSNGAVALQGWTPADRRDVSDVCAIRALQAAGSWALRQAIARAESQSGRKMNPLALAAGTHSHDGGKSWNPGH